MTKCRKKRPLSISKILELTGKPIYLLFIFCLIALVSLIQLITVIIQKLLHSFSKRRLTLPQLSQFSLPRLKSTLVKVTILIVFVATVSYALYSRILKDLPSPKLLRDNPPALSTKILDRKGRLLYQIYKDENRSLIKLGDVPNHLISATLAAEDKNFYRHFGVDPTGIARAVVNNVKCYLNLSTCSTTIQGGSTITQQLIKNTLLSSEKTLTRKLKELVLAIQTEQMYSKDEILTMYLNQVPYGGTAYGIEEASWQYLGKSAREINLSEAAFLAGLPVSPTTLSPFGTYPYLAKIRQQQVLESMVAIGMISENDKIAAVTQPINLSVKGKAIYAPHFVMYVRDLLVKQYGESMVSRGGLTVTTTLDLELQNILQSEIETELSRLTKLNINNGAGLVIAPQTGEILAMVGSRNFFDSSNDGQVNVVLQPRQPGSAIKPLTYALAFSRGLSPSSTIIDAPICFRQAGSPDYCPKNYDGQFHGTVTLKNALANSYNIPAIKLLNGLGVNNLVELARSMGITTWNDPGRFGLALTLGGGEVTMLDLAQAYAVFATGGNKIPLNPILSITTAQGNNLTPEATTTPKQVLSSSVAFQINQSLSDNNARSAAFGTNSVLNIPGKTVAVKTGTTNNLRDNWTIGYTQDLLVATWVGNNDNSPMSYVASGVTGASPIWSRTIQKIIKDTPNTPFIPPPTMVRALVSCDHKIYDYFIKGQEPKLNCNTRESGQIL